MNQQQESRSFQSTRAVRRRGVADVEEQSWVGFYRRIGDPSVAAEVVEYLKSDPDLKRACPALYLLAKQTVKRHEARQARARRVGAFVRRVVASTVRAVARWLGYGRDVAFECLPEVAEPAPARVASLSRSREISVARREFETSQGGAAKAT